MTTVSELHIGDTVRFEGGNWTDDPRHGMETTVTGFSQDGRHAFVETDRARHVDDRLWPFVLVTCVGETPEVTPKKSLKKALAAGEYHPDLLPLLERISQVADAAGYCGQYDDLAREVGLPDRARVKALVEERDGATYRVRYTLPIPIDIVVTGRDVAEVRAEASRQVTRWPQIVRMLEARIADLKARDRLYLLGDWDGEPTITRL